MIDGSLSQMFGMGIGAFIMGSIGIVILYVVSEVRRFEGRVDWKDHASYIGRIHIHAKRHWRNTHLDRLVFGSLAIGLGAAGIVMALYVFFVGIVTLL